MTRAGAFRETGALRFFFSPKGALTHHLPVGQAVVLPLCVSRALCEADCALCGERQTMLPCLRASVIIVCAEERCAVPPPAKTCHRQLFTALRGTGAERTNGGISI